MKLTLDLTPEQVASLRAQLDAEQSADRLVDQLREAAAKCPEHIAEHVRIRFHRGYLAKRASALPQTRSNADALKTIALWVKETADARRTDPFGLADALCKGFFASQKAAEAEYRPQWLAQDPCAFLPAPRGAQAPRQGHTMSELTPEQKADQAAALRGEPNKGVYVSAAEMRALTQQIGKRVPEGGGT